MSTRPIPDFDNEWSRRGIQKMQDSLGLAYSTQHFRVMPAQGERCVRAAIRDYVQSTSEPSIRELASEILTQIALKNLPEWIKKVEDESLSGLA